MTQERNWLLGAGDLHDLQGLVPLAIVTVAAVVGLMLALGARGLARDLVRGIALRSGGQLRPGDHVEVAGRSGVVEDVGLFNVRLRDRDGAVHFLRNATIDAVTNRSFGRSYAVLDVAVAGRDLERELQCLRDAATELRRIPGNALRVLDDLEVEGVERCDETGLHVRVRIPVAPGQHASVRRELLAACHRRLSNLTVA